jgi:phosphoribosylformimino-5-aminoimidazole carboxamide ribotide isomerase
MTAFTIYPAIDLKNGEVVRLKQGRKKDSKTFDLSPRGAAETWIAQGAAWLHVVNLDGAFGEDSSPNLTALKEILAAARGKALLQFGGGLRSMDDIEQMLALGVDRVILGTAAVENPGLLSQTLDKFGPERVVLGIDARDSFVRIAGWEKATVVTPVELAERYKGGGLRKVIYTNVQRDGMQTGVDIESTKELASATGLEVIASGGVSSLQDIYKVKAAGLPGVVVGKALYEKNFTLSEAIQC